eukprot:9554170-Heterocapsa_arctica.AAC.2
MLAKEVYRMCNLQSCKGHMSRWLSKSLKSWEATLGKMGSAASTSYMTSCMASYKLHDNVRNNAHIT